MDLTTTAADRRSPAGAPLPDRRRPRSAGVLDAEARAAAAAAGIALAYDPVQGGWVPADALDDIDPWAPGDALGEAPHGAPGQSAGEMRGAPAAHLPGLRFRPWRAEEAGRLAALLDDPEVWRHLPETYPDPLDADTAAALIEVANTAAHHEVLAIETGGSEGGSEGGAEAGEVVGQVRLSVDPARPGDWREAEIAYWLGRGYWGRGLGSAAVAAFTERAFRERPGLEAVFARVHGENAASARILEKAGYAAAGADPSDQSWRIYRRRRADALSRTG